MAETKSGGVDEYLASQPEAAREVLMRVRSAIRKALPNAEEVISYKIPTYKINGVAVVYFAGWKKHYSIYPASDRLIAAFQEGLAAYEVCKSTIRFPIGGEVPMKLIEQIAKFRMKEVEERE